MWRPFRLFWVLIREVFLKWNRDKGSRMAAAIAYYAAFSLAPLLLVVIAGAALFYGEKAAEAETVHRLNELIGEQGANALKAIVENAQSATTGTTATVLSVLIILYGSTRIFTELRYAMNVIWAVEDSRPVIKSALLDHLVALAMVLGVGMLLIGSLAASTALQAMERWFVEAAPDFERFADRVYPVTSFLLLLVVFAVIFKVMPATRVAWRDVAVGAIVTTALFTAGKFGIGYYLSRTTVLSVYGAAGSLIVLLLWIYYSTLIVLLGAVITKVWSERIGSRHRPRTAKPGSLPES